jgi:hypothetical protein
VSGASLKLFEAAGFQWVASGESVLRNSLRRSGRGEEATGPGPMYRPYTLGDGKLACFFRDDGLSDLIGFKYSTGTRMMPWGTWCITWNPLPKRLVMKPIPWCPSFSTVKMPGSTIPRTATISSAPSMNNWPPTRAW